MTGRRELAQLCLCTALAVLGLFFAMNSSGVIHRSGDSSWYLAVARDPFVFQEAPYSFRVLTPLIVGAFPFLAPEKAFAVVSVVSLIVTGVLLHVFLRRMLGSSSAANWGLCLFLLCGTTLQTLYFPVLVDPLAYCFVQAGFILGALGRWRLAAVTLAVGVIAKEHVIFAVPALMVFSRTTEKPALLWSTALLAILPAAFYGFLHYTPFVFGSVPRSYGYFSVENIRFVLAWVSQWGSLPKVAVSSLLLSFNVLWLMAVIGFVRSGAALRATAILPLCLLPTFFIATDWQRMLYFAFPSVIALAATLPLKRPIQYTILAVLGLLGIWVPFSPSSGAKHLVTGALLAVGAVATLPALPRPRAA